MEGSKRGTFMSTFALFAIATLFFMETKAYFSSRYVSFHAYILLKMKNDMRMTPK